MRDYTFLICGSSLCPHCIGESCVFSPNSGRCCPLLQEVGVSVCVLNVTLISPPPAAQHTEGKDVEDTKIMDTRKEDI